MQKITPCLWFDMNCEEAVTYYVSVFNGAPNKTEESKIVTMQRYEEGMQTPDNDRMLGKVITAIFDLDGQRYMALDGGTTFKLSEAVSFQIECKDQAEVDYFWKKLSAVPEAEQCGWCKDKFGMSWQIIPTRLGELLGDPDKEKAHRVMNAMLEMHKIVVEDLEKAGELVTSY